MLYAVTVSLQEPVSVNSKRLSLAQKKILKNECIYTFSYLEKVTKEEEE